MPGPNEPFHTTDRSAVPANTASTRVGSHTPASAHTLAEGPGGSTANAELVPGYEIRGELKRGGMGVVLAARHVALDREAAIKTIRPDRPCDPRTFQRFITESHVTAKLQHPGVPPVFEVGQFPDGRPYLVMKLIRGKDLEELLKARGAPNDELPRFLAVFAQICHAVGYAHSQGVIHRDLKPANVMVGEFGEVQVMDWGIAKTGLGEHDTEPLDAHEEPSDTELTRAGSAMGTPAYMAPEQARGEWATVDSRADVFALGGILADILTGQPPFVAPTAQLTVVMAGQGQVQEAYQRLDACGADSDLITIAKRCLRPNRDERPADGKVVADLILTYLAGVEARLRTAETERAAAKAKAEESRLRAVAEAEAKQAAEERADEATQRAKAEAAKAAEQRKRRRTELLLAAAIGLLLLGAVGFAWIADREKTRRTAERKELEAKAEAEHALHEKAEAEQKAAFAKTEAAQKLSLHKAETERNAAIERTRAGVNAAIKLCDDLRTQHKFREAGDALTQAEDLASAGGAEDLKQTIQRERANLEFARELDAIRSRKWAWVPAADGDGGMFDSESAPSAYAQAFAARGLDVTNGDPEALAKQIATSPIRADILRALDDWALDEKNPTIGAKVLEFARYADPAAELANRFRAPALHRDRLKQLPLPPLAEELAVSAPAALLVAGLLERRNANPSVVLAIAFARHPTDFDLALALALWFHNRDPQKAIGYYRAARALRPEHATVLTNLGLLLSTNGENGAAVAVLKEAVRIHPRDHVAHFNLGGAYSRQQSYSKAEAEYRETIRLSPKYADAYANLGAVLGHLKKNDEALKVLAEALELAPNNVRVRINYGAALQNSGKLDLALSQFLEAVKIASKYAPAYNALGSCYEAQKNLPEAYKAYREAARLDPKQYGDLLKKIPSGE